MTKSMTAFALAESPGVTWELRSVNQRYLDVTFRMPESLRVLEIELRGIVKSKLHRGKVDCVLRLNSGGEDQSLEIDEELLGSLARLQERVAELTDSHPSKSALDLLRWPGVLREPDRDAQHQVVTSLFAQAIDDLITMRQREGAELQRLIEEKLEQFAAMVDSIRAISPGVIREHQRKMAARLAELAVDADPGRLEQEMVIIANKADIAEEFDRLDTHILEVRNTLAQTGAIGRRLDFLMQELNREANTLSSKALATDTSLTAVDLKVTIEQMREQVQNIE